MKNKIVLGICSLAVLALMPGCVVEGPPPPVAAEVTVVPDSYVWDGYEYVGLYGDQYYYLGPGNVWTVCDPVRLARFHDYVRVHPDWHAHATVNVRFRGNAPKREPPHHAAPPPRKDDHDQGYGH